jgi:hypothetical protein
MSGDAASKGASEFTPGDKTNDARKMRLWKAKENTKAPDIMPGLFASYGSMISIGGTGLLPGSLF